MNHRDKKERDYYFSHTIYTTIYVNKIKAVEHLMKNKKRGNKNRLPFRSLFLD